MHVLFDGFWWVAGPAANRTVLREFVFEWIRQFPQDSVTIAVPFRDVTAVAAQVSSADVVPLRARPHGVSNVFELPLIARRVRADVSVVHNYTPLIGPAVVFVHDLLFEEHAEWFSRVERAYFAPMALLARRARQVVTSTSTEARRMMRLHGSLAPVRAIGLAVATELQQASAAIPKGMIGSEFFSLSVGRLNARKNLERTMVGALRSGRVTLTTPLVVVGSGAHSEVGIDLPAEVRPAVESGAIRLLGRISDSELRWLYEHAALTTYLSMDEGFGLPPVEAASFGSPVLVSDLPVFRETLGDTASFVNPFDVTAISAAFEKCWDHTRAGAEQRILDMRSQHSWATTVSRLRRAAVDAASSVKDP